MIKINQTFIKRGLFFFAFIFFGIVSNIKAQELLIIESDNLKCNDSILIFTPQNLIDTNCINNKKFNGEIPSLFLLHGWSGSYKDWSNHYNLQQISNETGFRIICPDGFYDSWYVNNVDSSQMQWRKFFDEELYPQLGKKYELKRATTFITGLSMGGHGAINIFIDDTSRFRTAGSMSGVLDFPSTTLKKSVANKFGGIFENCEQESATNRVEKIKGLKTPLIITCGYNDYYASNAEKFCSKCKELEIPFVQIMSPATHSWKYWGFALDEHIKFFTKVLLGENLGY